MTKDKEGKVVSYGAKKRNLASRVSSMAYITNAQKRILQAQTDGKDKQASSLKTGKTGITI